MEKESARERLKRCLVEVKSPDPEVREKAVYGLRYTRSKAGREAIIRALDDPDPNVRRAALSVVRDQPGLAYAVPKLISMLKVPSLAFGALRALSSMKDPSAIRPMAELLRSHSHCIRGLAARCLGWAGDSRAFKPLVAALKNAESAQDRMPIWSAIGRIGCADKVKHLSHLMEMANWSVRPEDRRAMLEPSDKPVRKLRPKEVAKINADIAELASADPAARDRAIVRLGRRRGQVVEFLAEASASPHIEARYGALFALGRVGDLRAYPVVLELAKDPIADLRWFALETLGRLWGERALPVLIEVLRTSEACEDLAGAGEGLEAVGKPAVPLVIEVLNTSSGDLRMRAATILREIGDERAIPHIAKLLDDPDPDMRIAGQEEIAIMGEDQVSKLGPTCLKLVERMLHDSDEKVRENARHWFDDLSEMVNQASAEVSAPLIS